MNQARTNDDQTVGTDSVDSSIATTHLRSTTGTAKR